MADKSKRTPKYDSKVGNRKRDLGIQIGLTAVVIVFAVALVLYIVLSGEKQQGERIQAIRVASADVIVDGDAAEPKAVISVYGDFQCRHCRTFEDAMGPTLKQIAESGAAAVDYYMVAIQDTPANNRYASRAANAAYCVAQQDTTSDKQQFQEFHRVLFTEQPTMGGSVPDDVSLVATAQQAGASADVAECITGGANIDLVQGLAAASGINATPSVRVNGEDYQIQHTGSPGR